MYFTLTGAVLGFLCGFVIGNLRGTIEPPLNLNTIETDLGYVLPFVIVGAFVGLGVDRWERPQS
jgi:hypothetical protein